MSFDDKVLDIPETLPMLPVRDIVVFPYMILPLYVGREGSIRAVEEALSKNRLIFLASQKEITEENPTEESIYKTGTIAMIMRMRKLSDGRVKILIQGVAKGKIEEFKQADPNFTVKVEKLPEDEVPGSHVEYEAMIRNAKEQLEKIIALGRVLSPDILLVLDDVTDPGRLADLIASNLGLKVSDAQNVLETDDPKERLNLVNEILANELEVLQMQARIRNTAKDEMSKSQREYFLREQMRAIKNELGEMDSKTEDMEELRERVMKAGMPEEVQQEAVKQLGRLERMHPDASEASMVRTYLDWMVDLPWNKTTKDNMDLTVAQKYLDEDHYDLHKAKDRIMEFLAVRKLKKDMKGPILCFVGPPGVGKTSLGKSIAKAMGRNYFRISLGGVKDEAEIRGHRRTYVGAMPGKIVQALKQVESNNPVIVLDEIDKLGSDFRGDPSAAMLEVLDPEQNATFRDNYLNVDFDLSNALFIATANVFDNIPPALRDRMETIHISGYTENDKLLITKAHVIDRQIKNNGLEKDQINFTDDGVAYLISHYTREAGLRNLEREVGSVCRKVAKQIVMGEVKKVTVTPEVVVELLGPPKYMRDEALKEHQVGIVTGLAWTQAGGETLFVEALGMKGKGNLVMTGQLGDVMKESGQAAWSYAKSHQKELGISADWFEKNDVHIHLPAGAIPKDGPSAGITIATALISLMTDTPVRHDIAMTGEVTLAGRVLPIGGVKEKALAALTQGVTNIILPLQNKKDLADIPEEFKKKLSFQFVENLDEVLALAFDKTAKKSRRGSKGGKKAKTPTAASAA
ncbi:MAG: endopeptidase La [Bdellovibrionaceae bacterium]|nr:endopeptidase La [Pseudobdellovibrionaceae bacterium]|tara:strand:- start:170103 stop:172511 length:2409 start_codon:yes stop_codon:yes gene_type:complete